MQSCKRDFGRSLMIGLAAFCLILTLWPKEAQACPSCRSSVTHQERIEWEEDVETEPQSALDDREYPVGTTPFMNQFIVDEFTAHQENFVTVLWADHILPALMLMADQLTAVAMQQTQIFGTFMDAQIQVETQRSFQEIQARAHKDYQPSVGMCEFGSNIKSLAASEHKAGATAVILSQRSLDRQLGNANTVGGGGRSTDQESRINQFKRTYCDTRDNNNGLTTLCTYRDDSGNTRIGAQDRVRTNKDIDFTRTIDAPWTLDVDFLDEEEEASPDEADVFALASNLYSHDVLVRMPFDSLGPALGEEMTNKQEHYLDARSLVAKRSVAENSFNAITAMKASGTGGSRDFMAGVMEELGITDPAKVLDMIGESPSYYAQMEVLTKKIYQNPDFYTNLYDKPANVQRKSVALQALALMQKFDAFKSHLRTEASLSVLLELAVMDLQDEVEKDLGSGTATEAQPVN